MSFGVLRFVDASADVAGVLNLSESLQFQLLAALWGSDPSESMILASLPVAGVSIIPADGIDSAVTLAGLESCVRPAAVTSDALFARLAAVEGGSDGDNHRQLFVLVSRGSFVFFDEQVALGAVSIRDSSIVIETTESPSHCHRTTVIAAFAEWRMAVTSNVGLPPCLVPAVATSDDVGDPPAGEDSPDSVACEEKQQPANDTVVPVSNAEDPCFFVATAEQLQKELEVQVQLQEGEDLWRDRHMRDEGAAWVAIGNACRLSCTAMLEQTCRSEIASSAVAEMTAVRSVEAQAIEALLRRQRSDWAAAQLRFESRVAFAVAAERLRTVVSDERQGREQLRANWAEGLLGLVAWSRCGSRLLPIFPPLFPPSPRTRTPRTPRQS
jgi:hypothetical protein